MKNPNQTVTIIDQRAPKSRARQRIFSAGELAYFSERNTTSLLSRTYRHSVPCRYDYPAQGDIAVFSPSARTLTVARGRAVTVQYGRPAVTVVSVDTAFQPTRAALAMADASELGEYYRLLTLGTAKIPGIVRNRKAFKAAATKRLMTLSPDRRPGRVMAWGIWHGVLPLGPRVAERLAAQARVVAWMDREGIAA